MDQRVSIDGLAHQLARVLKTDIGGRENPCVADLRGRAARLDFGGKKMQILFEHASPTAASYVGTTDFWHLFRDYAAKRLSGMWSGIPEQVVHDSYDLILLSRWNIHNYRIIFDMPGMAANENAPDLFASPDDIGSFRGLLIYLDQTYLPALERALGEEFGLDQQQIAGGIDEAMYEFFDRDGMVGIEILSPLDPVEWTEMPEPAFKGAPACRIPGGFPVGMIPAIR